jgi:hypothetical protein
MRWARWSAEVSRRLGERPVREGDWSGTRAGEVPILTSSPLPVLMLFPPLPRRLKCFYLFLSLMAMLLTQDQLVMPGVVERTQRRYRLLRQACRRRGLLLARGFRRSGAVGERSVIPHAMPAAIGDVGRDGVGPVEGIQQAALSVSVLCDTP